MSITPAIKQKMYMSTGFHTKDDRILGRINESRKTWKDFYVDNKSPQ